MARVTLREIADQVGLSTFAVSRALSGKDGVSEATRQLVGTAAARLGYARAPLAPGPREIGVIFHDLDPLNSELRLQVQSGVQREARRLAKPVRLQYTHLSQQITEVARASAGVLLVGPHERETIDTIRLIGVPVVRLGWVDPLEQVDQVIATDQEAGRAVAEYLIGLGHRQIAYVRGMAGLRGRLERFHGVRNVTELQPDVTLHSMEFDEQAGFLRSLERLIASGTCPTAFFCAHDGLALTVVSELLRLGYRIPEDVSVVGFGDFAAATQISPQLTTVRIEGQEMGAVGLRLLIERIESSKQDPMVPRRIQITSRIIERRSSAACAGSPLAMRP